MSQALADTGQQARLLPAFNRPPSNPFTEAVNERLAQLGSGSSSKPDEAAAQQTPPEPSNPPQPVTTPSGQSPSDQAVPQPQQPTFTPIDTSVDTAAYLQALENERQRAAADAAEKDKVIANLLEQQKEYEALKQQMALQKAIDPSAFDQLNSVDANDAKVISNTVLAATNAALAPLQKELAESRRMMEERFAQSARTNQANQIGEYNRRILAKHPDYFDLMNTKEYRAFMSGRDEYESKTRDQRAAEEFLAGNTDYVINLLDRLKGKAPSSEQLMTVAPVQSAPSSPAPEQKQDTMMSLGELNSLYQMRQITHDEYIKRLNAWRAAQSKE